MKNKIYKIGTILFVGILFCCIYIISTKNVLEKLYFLTTNAFYNSVQEVVDVYWYDWEWFNEFERDGVMTLELEEKSLDKGWRIDITFVEQMEKKINIYVEKELSNTTYIELCLFYNVKKKELICDPLEVNLVVNGQKEWLEYPEDKEEIMRYLQEYDITQEDIKGYLNYVLYDELVQSWVDAHGGVYSVEKKKIENCLIDNSCVIYE